MGKGQRQRLSRERQRVRDSTNAAIGLDPVQQLRLCLFDSSKAGDTQLDMTEKQAMRFLGVAENDSKEEYLKKYGAVLEQCLKEASFHLIQSKLTAAKKCLDAMYLRKEASESGTADKAFFEPEHAHLQEATELAKVDQSEKRGSCLEPAEQSNSEVQVASASTIEPNVRNNSASWAEAFCSSVDHVESVVGSSPSLQVLQLEGTEYQNLSELHAEESMPTLEDASESDAAEISITELQLAADSQEEATVSVNLNVPLTAWNELEVKDSAGTNVEQSSAGSEVSVDSTNLIADLNRELEEKNRIIESLERKLHLKDTEIQLLLAERDGKSNSFRESYSLN